MTSYFIDVRFERQLSDDLPILNLPDAVVHDERRLGGHLVRQFVGELQEAYDTSSVAGHFEVERVVLSSGEDIWRHGDPVPPYSLEEAVAELLPDLDKVKEGLPQEVQHRLAKVAKLLSVMPAVPQAQTPSGDEGTPVDLSQIARIPAPAVAA
ncbi:hypothetical protein P7L87_25840 [Vibrio parahaemolyticus]|nr:hypothetical protein [Vibrio parahaemolyticus]